MAKKVKTMTLSIDVKSGLQRKKLERLLNEGWRVVSSNKRSALSWGPNKTDYVLERDA